MDAPPRTLSAAPRASRRAPENIALALTAIAAALAHGFDSPPVPLRGAAGIESIAAIVWLTERCMRPGSRSPTARFDRGLALAVLVASVLTAALRSTSGGGAVIAFYVLGAAAVEAALRGVARLFESAGDVRRLSTFVVRVLLLIALIGTVLLALPVATHPAVPDYGHNFWRHISACAFMSVSAVTLCGATIYNVGEDLRPFGQAVLLGLSSAAAILFAALGLIALRPWLRRPASLRRVLCIWLALQGLAAAWIAAAAPASFFDGRWPSWTGLFVSGAALDQTAFALRQDGLARGVAINAIFWPSLGLMLAGSLGLVALIDRMPPLPFRRGSRSRLSGPADADGPSSPENSGGSIAAEFDLVGIELHAGIWMLCAAAGLLFLFESEGLLPHWLYLERPLDLGANQVPLREMPPAARWRAALSLAATVRSAGQHVAPLDPGAISAAGWVLLLGLMWVGGAVGSGAGGARIGSLAALLYSRELRRLGLDDVARIAARICLAMLGLALAAAAVLALFQDGAGAWMLVTEAVSMSGCVGVDTGLTPHLQWPCRLAMMAVMLAGRLIPTLGWCAIAAELGRARTGGMPSRYPA